MLARSNIGDMLPCKPSLTSDVFREFASLGEAGCSGRMQPSQMRSGFNCIAVTGNLLGNANVMHFMLQIHSPTFSEGSLAF
jgi:hypothetical protein